MSHFPTPPHPALHLLPLLLHHTCTPLPSVLVFVVHLSIHHTVSHSRWSAYYRMTEKEKKQNAIFLLLFFKSKRYRCCPVNDNINDQNWNCIGQERESNAVRRPKKHGNGQMSVKCRSQFNEMVHFVFLCSLQVQQNKLRNNISFIYLLIMLLYPQSVPVFLRHKINSSSHQLHLSCLKPAFNQLNQL